MTSSAVVLVGHGAVPRDYPRERLLERKRLTATRSASGDVASAREVDLEQELRRWPRSPETDRYQVGLEQIAEALRTLLPEQSVAVAYNEFCAPTLAQAVATLVQNGARSIVVVPSMITPGGSHSEHDIPEAIEALRVTHPEIDFRYAWPFVADAVAGLLAEQVIRAGALPRHVA